MTRYTPAKNIAMENGQFEDVFPTKKELFIARLVYRRVDFKVPLPDCSFNFVKSKIYPDFLAISSCIFVEPL